MRPRHWRLLHRRVRRGWEWRASRALVRGLCIWEKRRIVCFEVVSQMISQTCPNCTLLFRSIFMFTYKERGNLNKGITLTIRVPRHQRDRGLGSPRDDSFELEK